jgi:hypothetical protein
MMSCFRAGQSCAGANPYTLDNKKVTIGKSWALKGEGKDFRQRLAEPVADEIRRFHSLT